MPMVKVTVFNCPHCHRTIPNGLNRDDYGNVIPIFVERALSGRDLVVFGDGEQTSDFVHVRDVAWANVAAAEHASVSGVFNLGSATRVTINWLAERVAEFVGTAVQISHGPERSGDVRDSLADVKKAAAEFGYAPTVDLLDGLREYVAWLKADPVRLATRTLQS